MVSALVRCAPADRVPGARAEDEVVVAVGKADGDRADAGAGTVKQFVEWGIES